MHASLVLCPLPLLSRRAARYLETDSKALTRIPVEVEKTRASTPKMSVRKAAKSPEEGLPMPTSEEGLWWEHVCSVCSARAAGWGSTVVVLVHWVLLAGKRRTST